MRERKGEAIDFGNRKVSIVEQARKTETKDYYLKTILNWIKEGKGKFAENVREVRKAVKEGDKDRASEAKLNLPAAMFSGTFSKRSSKELTEHSGILCLDFDHLDNPQKAVDDMRYDPHIIAGFVSPSGTGCKCLIAIPRDSESHREAFLSASSYIKTVYGLEADESGKDVSRLCFLSYDPQLASELVTNTIKHPMRETALQQYLGSWVGRSAEAMQRKLIAQDQTKIEGFREHSGATVLFIVLATTHLRLMHLQAIPLSLFIQ